MNFLYLYVMCHGQWALEFDVNDAKREINENYLTFKSYGRSLCSYSF